TQYQGLKFIDFGIAIDTETLPPSIHQDIKAGLMEASSMEWTIVTAVNTHRNAYLGQYKHFQS
ncbi:10462_t:CDS:2, partial [Dentiscutata heterogama]